MRRSLLVLALTLLTAAPALAQRGGTPPPPPPAPRPATPVPPAPPARASAPVHPSEEHARVPIMGVVSTDSHAPRSWRTVRLDVVITDSIAGTKAISMVLVDGKRGSIRSQTGPRMLNADAVVTLPDSAQIAARSAGRLPPNPQAGEEGKLLVDLTVIYQPQGNTSSLLNESLSVVVPDGVTTLVSQAADPENDRKVSVEVTATSLK